MANNRTNLIQVLQDSVALTNKLSGLLLTELQVEASQDVAEKSVKTLNVKKAQEEVVVDEDMLEAIIEKGRPEILKLAKTLGLDFKRTDKTDSLIESIREHLGFDAPEEEPEEDEEDEVEEDEVDEDDEDEEAVDLESMDHKELVSFIEENFEDVAIPKKKKTEKVAEYAERLREFIETDLLGAEADEEPEEDDEEEEEVVAAPVKKSPAKKAPKKETLIVAYENEDEEEEEVDLLEMTAKELREFASDFGITLPTKKNVEQLAQLVYEAFQEEAEAEEEEVIEEPKKAPKTAPKQSTQELEEEYGLDELELEDLAEILTENGLSAKGKRPALVARIIKGIEDGTIDVEEE